MRWQLMHMRNELVSRAKVAKARVQDQFAKLADSEQEIEVAMRFAELKKDTKPALVAG